MHENRETSEMPAATRNRPAGKGNRHTSRMHVSEESDSGIVPMNPSNKDGKPAAESEEGRPLIKENIIKPARPRHRARFACPRVWRVCEKQQGKGRRRSSPLCFTI